MSDFREYEEDAGAMSHAPAFLVAAGWLCAAACKSAGLPPILSAFAALFGCCALACSCLRRDAREWRVFVLICALSAGGAYFIASSLAVPQVMSEVSGRAVVVHERSWGRGRMAVVASDAGRFAFFVPWGLNLPEGTTVDIRGKARNFRLPKERGAFDEGNYWRARGVGGVLEPVTVKVIAQPEGYRLWRNEVKSRLMLVLPPAVRGYMLAAWTGYRDPVLGDMHSMWGTSHILAISGFHVGIFVLFISLFFKSSRAGVLLQSLLVWGYVFFAGAPASAVRAAAMVQAYLLASLVGRPKNSINALCSACIVLLLVNPWFYYDLGFRLSVISVAVILSFIKRPFLVCPAVWLGTYGPVSMAFGGVPLAGVLINFMAMPFFAAWLPAASLAAVFAVCGVSVWPAFVAEEIVYGYHMFSASIVSVVPWRVPWSPYLFAASSAMVCFAVMRCAHVKAGDAFIVTCAAAGAALSWGLLL